MIAYLRAALTWQALLAMSRSPSLGLFAHVQSYFTEYLPRQRGASVHTIRAYRDALTLLFKFVSEQSGRGVASLQRDYTLLLFLYNCGARVSEAAGLRWDDLQLTAPRQVRLRGKGKKERLLPLWPETANALHRLRGMSRDADGQCVFVNRHGQPLTRDGIAYILTKYATAAAQDNPALMRKHITPHVLRHSCAVALLQSGTDVTVIRDYLGHTSVATTGRYITINLQMKRDAMQAFWKKACIEPVNAKSWKPKGDLLAFLQSL
ncbi:tyrosine-type recombinase/integrase [Burkholderia sp. MSMB1589WGS]|uniref:tyrosine-type recombinase/integrase n=1 Tax=Burkholderia sp. MSMB1589WGS TaxID=1636425 RepID=UPI000AC9B565|nr:tyrosine-type recombinase/integrase [Burkholderia sp. MSMB1589WGS]